KTRVKGLIPPLQGDFKRQYEETWEDARNGKISATTAAKSLLTYADILEKRNDEIRKFDLKDLSEKYDRWNGEEKINPSIEIANLLQNEEFGYKNGLQVFDNALAEIQTNLIPKTKPFDQVLIESSAKVLKELATQDKVLSQKLGEASTI